MSDKSDTPIAGVTRYSLFGTLDGGGPAEEFPDQDGEYVRYEDYAKVERELAEKEAECAALREDAERYRWLREQVSHDGFIPIAQCVWKRFSNPHEEWVNLGNGSDLDSHIDSARQA